MSPQHRRRRSMVVGVALAILAASASASAQDFLDHVNADANRNAGSSGVRAASVLDVDRLVATAVDRGVLLQRARPGQRGNSNANTMRWAGIAMLGAGACWPSTGRSPRAARSTVAVTARPACAGAASSSEAASGP